jgi:hypothetical protein
MAYWGGSGMGGGGGGGGMGGGFGNRAFGGRGINNDSLRRSVDAWDDDDLGSAYNHAVTMRLLTYVAPYKLRAILSVIGVIGSAVLLNYQPAIIQEAVDAAVAGDIEGVIRASLLFFAFALGGWLCIYIQLSNAGWIGHRVLLKLRTEMLSRTTSRRCRSCSPPASSLSSVTSSASRLSSTSSPAATSRWR